MPLKILYQSLSNMNSYVFGYPNSFYIFTFDSL